MNNRKIISITICTTLMFAVGLSIVSYANNESGKNAEAESYFEKANELRKKTDYEAAITEYNKIISTLPNSRIAQDAQYWIAQSYFELRQFDTSLSEFKKLLDAYPDSPIVQSTKLMIERIQHAKKNRSLFDAVKKGDIEQIKQLMAEGVEIDTQWGDVYNKKEGDPRLLSKFGLMDSTPLWHAVDSNNLDVVKLLVEADPNVNAGTWPPLCRAVDVNNTVIAEYLIDHGANINYPGDWGPLHEASCLNIEMVKLLLERGGNINDGNIPPLHAAAMKGPKNIVEFLIQRGADINAKDIWGCTPLFWSVNNLYSSTQNENSDILETMTLLIANGADVDSKTKQGWPNIFFAVEAGKKEAVKLLLEAEADISLKDDTGQAALHIAAQKGHTDIVELLLEKEADVNMKDKDGRTPLHLSADLDIVKLLLEKGADVNAKEDKSGFTALHNAVRFGKTNIIELLISRDADINAKDKDGHSPLYIAVKQDSKIAELLINKGADSSIKTESGKTLLELAQQRKKVESPVKPDMIFEGEPNSMFGLKMACGDIDGDGFDDILIGAYQYDNNRGRVSLFYGGPDMDSKPDLILEGENKGDWFGNGIACGDIDNDGYDDIVIAAGCYNERQGRVYLYWGSDRNSMDANPDKVFVGEQEKGSQFGAGCPVIYDIDNDGYDDIIMAAIYSNNKTGKVYLYYGNTKESMGSSHGLIFIPKEPEFYFGYSISCGDVDNDGFGDIIIGPYYNRNGARTYLYYGANKSNMDAKADVLFEVNLDGADYFGKSSLCADLNRDGYDDIIIGAPGYNKRQGRAYVFQGSPKRSMNTDPDIIFDSNGENYSYGGQAVCGDIDGDQVNDLVIGAGGSGQRSGRAYVYWGSELSNSDPKMGRIFTGENPEDEFGTGLACGDVNNDGFDDLFVGAYNYKAGAKQGRVYLYYGGPK